jgi:hypothetical protein
MSDSSVVLDLTFASRTRGDTEANVKSTTLAALRRQTFLSISRRNCRYQRQVAGLLPAFIAQADQGE